MIDEESSEREGVLVFLQRPHPLTDHQPLLGLVEKPSGPEDLESEDRIQVWPEEHHVDPPGIHHCLQLPNHLEPLVRGGTWENPTAMSRSLAGPLPLLPSQQPVPLNLPAGPR